VSARPTITVLGGAREVGANSYYLTLGEGVLLDAGLHPRRHGEAALPALPGAGDEGIDVEDIIVSHAHLDHVGALPVALKRFPRAHVHVSAPTAPLAIRMLRNAVAIARGAGAPARPGPGHGGALPLYNDDQVEWVEQVLRTHEPNRPFSLHGRDAPRATLYNAGHLLGAAGVLLEHGALRIFYTGDTCASAQYFSPGATYPEGPIDLLLTDSTHGGDPGPDLASDERGFATAGEELGEFIRLVAARGGSVLIPVFALGRCQEILGVLHELRVAAKIPALPLYISGLANAFCRIYDSVGLDPGWRLARLRLEDTGYRVLNAERWSDPALLAAPSLLLVSSGMMFSGTSSHALAARMLPDPRHGIAFVGFLDQDSPGHRVASATPGDEVDMGPFGAVRAACEVRKPRFTGHSRASQLLATVERMRPRHVVLVHGDSESVGALAACIAGLRDAPRVTIAEQGVPISVTISR
jgi:Cft2 family RNA processing exonuclease